MKKIITSGKFLLIGAIAFFLANDAAAQCKGFVKKEISKLSPYIHNGQVNSSVLLSGDKAELTLTFYAGQSYRLLVSTHEALGKTYFIMKDATGKQLFTNKDKEGVGYWDFNVESTQQLVVQLVCPDQETASGVIPSGCVSILVGFKQ